MILLSQRQAEELLTYGEGLLVTAVTSAPLPRPPKLALLDEEYGVFATLRRGEELRGCIGSFWGSGTVRSVLPRVIREAALLDPRFPPVTQQELAGTTLSVSLLSRSTPVSSHERIELGRHGIILTVGRRRAIFLPEVALEQSWDLPTTLEMLTRKAGAPPGSWRGPDARFSVFETVKIGRHPDSHCPGVLVEPSAGRIAGCRDVEVEMEADDERQ